MGGVVNKMYAACAGVASIFCLLLLSSAVQAATPRWVSEDFPGRSSIPLQANAANVAAAAAQSSGVSLIDVGKQMQVLAFGNNSHRVYTIINSGQVDSSLIREKTAAGFREHTLGRTQSIALLRRHNIDAGRYLSKPTAHAACFPACVLIPIAWAALGAAFEYVILGERNWETIAEHFVIDAVGAGVLGATARIASGLYKVAQATRVGGAILTPAERLRSAKRIVDLADRYNRAKINAFNSLAKDPITHTVKRVNRICNRGTALFSKFWCARFQARFTKDNLTKYGSKAIDEIAKFSTAEFASWAWEKITGVNCRGWWEGRGLGRAATDFGRMSLGAFCTGIVPAGVFTGPAWANDVAPTRRMSISADSNLKAAMLKLLPSFTKAMREEGRPVYIELYAAGKLDTPADDAAHGRGSLGVSWRQPTGKDAGGLTWSRGAIPRYGAQCRKPPICTGQMWVVTKGVTSGAAGDFVDWLRNSQEASNILYRNNFYSLYKGADSYTVNHYLKFTVDSHLYPIFALLAKRYVFHRRSMGQPVYFDAWKTSIPYDGVSHGRADFGIIWRPPTKKPGVMVWYRAANWALPMRCTPHCVDQFWFTARADSIMPAGLEFIHWIRTSPVAKSILSPKWNQVN